MLDYKKIEELKRLLADEDAHEPPWEADVDDPGTRPFWTGKFYTDNGCKSWCTYGAGETSAEHAANARLAAAAVSILPELIKFWEQTWNS